MIRAALLGMLLGLLLGACSLNVDYGGTGGSDGPPPTCAAAIGAGTGHACAIRDDGVASCWGDNSFGQLGDNSTTLRTTPVEVVDPSTLGLDPPGAKLPALASIAGGGSHTCAIDVTGNVWCWGANDQNQLGVGTAGSSYPVQVAGVTGAKKIVAGAAHTCALLGTGAITCWGANDDGELGNGNRGGHSTSPVTATLTGAIALAAGNTTTCAVDAAGVPQCWGRNEYGQFGADSRDGSVTPVAMKGVTGAIDVAVGDRFACALTSAGEVYCSGANDAGQIGEPYDDGQLVPNKVPLATKAVMLAAADRIACAIDDQQQLWCWGANDNRALAADTSDAYAFPVRPDVPDARQVAIGGGFVCVRSSDGLRCAGYDGTGALGDGVRTAYTTAQPVGGDLVGVKALAVGEFLSCALLEGGTASCWGINDRGQLGDATATTRPTPVPVRGLSGITKLVVGSHHACALLSDTTVACWGANDHGQLGDGSYEDHGEPRAVASGFDKMANRPLAPPLTGVVDLDAGGAHTCAVLTDHTIKCWGSNETRQLASVDPDLAYGSSTPITVAPAMTMPGAVAVTTGGAHTCVIDTAAGVWCWGADGFDQIGVADATDPSPKPVHVVGFGGQPIDALSSYRDFTCAHATNNSVWCWGYNGDGESGIDYAYTHETPTQVPSLAATKIAAGHYHVCAIATDGTVQCWGGNYIGQITGNTYGNILSKQLVAGVSNATDLAAGESHTCALAGGAVQCWGDDRAGELGNGVMARQTPVAPMLTCP